MRPLRKTGGKSLHALVGSAASGGEINSNIMSGRFYTYIYKTRDQQKRDSLERLNFSDL